MGREWWRRRVEIEVTGVVVGRRREGRTRRVVLWQVSESYEMGIGKWTYRVSIVAGRLELGRMEVVVEE